MIDPSCAQCVHWDSRDDLVGYCEEITGLFRVLPEVCVAGLAVCRTAAGGRCRLFEPSQEAQADDQAWKQHKFDLLGDAGKGYPASLG